MTVMTSREDVLSWLLAQGLRPTGVCADSRRIRAGDLFVAEVPESGARAVYARDALANGACAVLWAADLPLCPAEFGSAPVVAVENLHQLIGPLAQQVYGHPSRRLRVLAVTGTNGKTTVTQWLAQSMPVHCAVIGTLGAGYPGGMVETGFTTPDAAQYAHLLADFVSDGATACAVEASSIGLEEGRMAGSAVDCAVFTNLTRDHLDYHHSMEAYAAAKAKLFAWPGLRAAVVNHDDAYGRQLLSQTAAQRLLAYGLSARPDDLPAGVAWVGAEDVRTTSQGLTAVLVFNGQRLAFSTRIIGRHNLSNLLAVAAVLIAEGLSPAEIIVKLQKLQPPAGRMACYGGDAAPLVVVDYAHSPDALAHILSALRDVATARHGRLVCLFGCGGDRDPGKRPEMGRAAVAGADAVWITSDNPRSEDPEAILTAIAEGAPSAIRVVDRAQAIARVIAQAVAADVILLAGKGHERTQEIRGQRFPFDDAVHAQAALATWRASRVMNKPMRSVRLANAVPLSVVTDWLSAAAIPGAGSEMVQGVSTDTRTLQAGDLFIALRGEQFDAHEFLEDVREAGAVGAVVEAGHPILTSPALDGWPLIICDDTRHALGTLGQAWRARFDLPVVAITGSNGKTTTKELIAHLFRAVAGDEAVLSTLGNFNNEIGLPLTLLRLGPQHRYAVIELGMSHPGEIAALAQLAQPTIAVVTNAQRAHLAGLGSLAGVADEKGSLFDAIPEGGSAVVNLDDPHALSWINRLRPGRRALGTHVVGTSERADHLLPVFVCESVAIAAGQALRIQTPAGLVEMTLPLAGLHNASNATQALAAGFAAGLDLAQMAQAIASFAGVSGRLQHKTGIAGAVVIDDTYNANPDSMRAAINVLTTDATAVDTVLVMGDMGEVGPESAALHAEVGRYAAERGVGALFAVGPLSVSAIAGYGNNRAQQAHHFSSQETLIAALRPMLSPRSRVLIKGSRSARMENVVNALIEQPQG